MQSLSYGGGGGGSSNGIVDLNNSEDSIAARIKAYKTYREVSNAESQLRKTNGNSLSKSTAQLATQLDKIKDLQKRYLKDPPNSTDKLLGFLGETRGNGDETTKYLRTKVLEVAAKIEPKLAGIIKEQTIKALGCSQEQTYKGLSVDFNPNITPLSTLPQEEGIYIPIQSIDLASSLKLSPKTPFGRIFYETDQPSANARFRPYGGTRAFPMNKQLYILTESQYSNQSLGQINGQTYKGKSGRNLFDLQYTKTNSFGVTGDYYRVALIDRLDNNGNISNNVGEFLSDYYSTIKLVDSTDIQMRLINLLSGAVSINAQVGSGPLSSQSKFYIIAQRILGLCFDSRQEIDVSGTAKIAELDGVDDSFFEFTEVDLRNIDNEISNVQNGVMEFEDCENVKLPVDTQVLIDQLINFRDELSGQTTQQQVATMSNMIDSISQNPKWDPLIPSNFNASVAIDKNVLKKLPMAVASAVLSPKVLLPLYTLMATVQSAATYTYNQNVTSANTIIQSGNTVGGSASNVVTSGVDFLNKYRTFSIQTISLINNEFLKILFQELKKDILNLVATIITDVSKSSRLKKYAIILKLIKIILIVAQLINDYRKCKSLMSNIIALLDAINNIGPKSLISRSEIPVALLRFADFLPGYSPERATINTIGFLQSIGVPTGTLPDGTPNLMLQFNLASNRGVNVERAENEKIEIVLKTAFTGIGKAY
jgi:hypothetical protein